MQVKMTACSICKSLARIFLATASLALGARLAVAQVSADAGYSMPDWQKAAGGKMAFEVASIRLNKSDDVVKPNMHLNTDDDPVPPGGRFLADFPLIVYISFAYKLPFTNEEIDSIVSSKGEWVVNDHFVIEAKASESATKDQMRLMMQSLLAERFNLKVHFETREKPVLAMVLAKRGLSGSRLRPHTEGLPCDAKLTPPEEPSAPSVAPGGFVPQCGSVEGIAGPNHSVLLGGRNVTMSTIAGYLQTPSRGGRPVIDQTGVTGGFDFTLQWMPESIGTPDALGSQDPQGDQSPDFLHALAEELGLKLVNRKASLRTLAIDHLEMPTPN